ncbi:MAG: DUF5799 family protein [Halobacteriales archaeon]
MDERGWQDLIVGERMAVDQQFSDRIQASQFSQQEWGMIMTAVEFEIDGTGENARIVARTEQIEHVLPQLTETRQQMQHPMGGGGGDRGGSGGGLFDSIKSALGMDDDDTAEIFQEASRLADDYASALQEHLEDQGKWEHVREAATAESEASAGDEDVEERVEE